MKELLLCLWPYGNDMHGEGPILHGSRQARQ